MSILTMLQQDTFTSDGTSQRIDLPGGADYFVVVNQTEWAAANDRQFKYEWFPNLASAQAFVWNKTGGGNGVQSHLITSGGFTYRERFPTPEAAKTGTTISLADPAVATSTSHGYAVGDKVRIYNNTVMKQIGGMTFEITAADTNTFTLGYLDSSGFADAETVFSVRRIAPEVEVLPGAEFITKISKATSAVVTFSEGHNYKVDDLLYFRVPASFGMTEIDGKTGKITAITASTATVDIDSSGFTTFAFPLSTAVPFKFAFAGLAGKRGLYDDWFSSTRSLVDLDPFRDGLFVPYMYLPAGTASPAGFSGDVITWQAWRKEN